MHTEEERCNTIESLFTTLNNNSNHNIMKPIKSLQFPKLGRHKNENAEEWMGRLRLAAVECNYMEIDRQLKEQFIHEINDNDMLTEIIRELTKSQGKYSCKK